MNLKRVLVPIGIFAVVIATVGTTAGLLFAAYSVPNGADRPVETSGMPQEPEPDPTPTPAVKAPAELSELQKEDALSVEGHVWAGSNKSLPSGGSHVYTWQDGNRTMRVVLQEHLVVRNNAAINPLDDVVTRGTDHSIVRSQPWHGGTGGPVFRPESGGGLMTLPGDLLLALDPEWDQERVMQFFHENGILVQDVVELDFLENVFLLETLPGFPALYRANALAPLDGVVAASPNWARELELK